jgi:hypothetical protein
MKLSYKKFGSFIFLLYICTRKKNINMQSLKQFDNDYTSVEDDKYFDFDDPMWYDWLYSEGFERMSKYEDSYTYREYANNCYLLNNTDYWYWAKCFDYWLFRIYIFRDCIICEKEYDCGGLAGNIYFNTEETPINEIWDEIIEYIKANID